MASKASVEELISRLRQGDSDAESQLFHRYVNRLLALARQRLDRITSGKVDADDVVQSVYRSFFLRLRKGQFNVPDSASLWALLTEITLRKCGRRQAFYRAARRDAGREVNGQSPDETNIPWEAIAREPTPHEAAMLAETLEQIMRPMDQRQQQMMMFGLQGFNDREISEKVGRSQRTVRRHLQRVKSKLESMRKED